MLALATERLRLRDFGADDFDAFFATTQGADFARFYAEQETTRAFMQVIFERILASTFEEKRTKYQLLICLPTGEVVGTCGVRLEDAENQQASFGCAISQAYWGNGYAYEAAWRILDFGFATLPIHRVYAETIHANTRARRLAERLGMHLDGELRHTRYFRGRWWNTAVYSILREAWGKAS